MPLDADRARRHLADFRLEPLFVEELGWDRYGGRLEVAVDGRTYVLRGVAEKRGMVAFVAKAIGDELPDLATRRKIEHQAARSVHEHLIVYTDDTESTQIWQWVRREPGRSSAVREHTYHACQSGEALIQKLDALAFSFEEEAGLTIVDVTRRARTAFDVDRVTKRFYDRFKAEHDVFLGFTTGIKSQEDREWYASVMLNRLMFIYFFQKKGFLDDDRDYLRGRLRQMQETKGHDQFLSFYRHFLLRLFHEGLGQQERSSELDALLGDVPYLNGGLFDLHQLERQNDAIEIPDDAFELLFDFFDSYQWHLDDRPLRADNEINPEVLGYIFEQYVNQKQMGAYYTKEDVTGFMAASAILPIYLDRLAAAIGRTPWELLRLDARRYIPEALLHGSQSELPEAVGEEADAAAPDASDGQGDRELGADLCLPGESTLEVVDRRRWAQQLIEEIESGVISGGSAAAARNLELGTLALDFLAELDAPADVISAYHLLKDLAILDPTCGSGAFLFAALHLLRDIYLVVVDKAEELLADENDTPQQELEALVSELRAHPSRDYFVLKTIVLSNLYGVDLMEEAAEIARLRLFLALAACLQSRAELEPLPDLDMNVRAGNLLVGVTTPADAERQFEGSLLASKQLPKVVEQSHEAARVYREFIDVQRAGEDGDKMAALKEELRIVEEDLSEELDRLYFESLATGSDVETWRASHRPFHWFIEFPEVMQRGGFDVIIGNPPYIRKSRLDAYEYRGFETDNCPDIFAPCMERAAQLARPGGSFAMIVPIAFQFSEDYSAARKVISRLLPTRFVSTYSRNPSALFTAGLGVRSSIVVGRRDGVPQCLTTDTRRWIKEFRPFLFETNRYTPVPPPVSSEPWPRLGHQALVKLYQALTNDGGQLGDGVTRSGPSLGFKKIALYYLSVYLDEPPAWNPSGDRVAQTAVGALNFATEQERDVAFVLLAGRLAVWWWGATGDDFNVTRGSLMSFPIGLERVKAVWDELTALAADLRKEQPKHPIVTLYAGKEMGNYDMLRCRHITDRADQLVLETIGLDHLWPAVRLADARLAKATGERPGTEREWPFPWTPGS